MSQLNISMLTSYLRICIVFFVLIICINHNHVSANGIYAQTFLDSNSDKLTHSIYLDESFYLKNSLPKNIELARRGVWSRLFRGETDTPRKTNSQPYYSPTAPGYAFQDGQFHLIPFDKRTIPIELQKALYAHGIVGRRR